MVLRNDTSRMMGDYHVRFCERLEGETPSCLLSGPAFRSGKATKNTKKIHEGHNIGQKLMGIPAVSDSSAIRRSENMDITKHRKIAQAE